MGQVFISYSHADREYVEKLVGHLQERGIDYWYDYSMAVGSAFSQEIEDRIDGCAAFVPVLTPSAVASDWVRNEIFYAYQNKKPILPLLLDECRVPLELTRLHWERVIGGRLPSPAFMARLHELTSTTPTPPMGVGTVEDDESASMDRPVTLAGRTGSVIAIATLTGHKAPVGGIAYSPDGRLIATGATDRTVRIWNAINHDGRRVLRDARGPSWPVAFSPDGRRLLTGATDEFTTLLWDTETWTVIGSVSHHDEWVYDAAFSPDGRFIATGGDDGKAMLWDVGTRGLVMPILGLDDPSWPLTFLGGTTLAVANNREPTVAIWDMATPTAVRTIDGLGEEVTALAGSPDGKVLAVGNSEGLTCLRLVRTGQPLHVLSHHTGAVQAVAFAPNGHLVATGGADRYARIWDASTGRELHRLPANRGKVRALAFSPDGTRLAIAGGQNTVRIWHLG